MNKTALSLFIVMLCVACSCWSEPVVGDRIPLGAPRILLELEGTERDYTEGYEPDGRPRYFDSEATYRVDPDDGMYHFRFKTPESEDWQTIEWLPRSYVDVVVFARVGERDEQSLYSYEYAVRSLSTSRQPLDQFYLQSRARKLVGSGPEHFYTRVISRGGRLVTDALWSLKGGKKGPVGIPPGETMEGMALRADGYPAIVLCCAENIAPNLKSTAGVPGSIQGAIMPYRGIFSDCVKGITVGPGPEVPTLALLRSYLPLCEYQGWGSDLACVLLDRFLTKAEQAIEENPSNRQSLLVALLEDVKTVTQGKNTRVTPELDALFRLNVEAMIVLDEEPRGVQEELDD